MQQNIGDSIMMQDRKRPSRPGKNVSMQDKMETQHCFLQGGTLLLLALLGHELALRKPPNINQKWKPEPNTAVTCMGGWLRAHATQSSASRRVETLSSPGQFATKGEASIQKITNNLAKWELICYLVSCVQIRVFPIQTPLLKCCSKGEFARGAQLLSRTPSWKHRIRQMLSEKLLSACIEYLLPPSV